MLTKFQLTLADKRLPMMLFAIAMLCSASLECTAANAGIPRVGTIKDYPATGLMTGCSNLYFYPAIKTSLAPDAYIFLSRGDGSNAWMNLDGRDVRLTQIKRPHQAGRHLEYRWGNTRIFVVFADSDSANGPAGDIDSMFKMKITLKRGRSLRIVQAVGDSDC